MHCLSFSQAGDKCLKRQSFKELTIQLDKMVMSPPRRPVADVVFLVEATSNLESSFSDIKSNYIGQILSHFNPACADDSDMAIDVSRILVKLCLSKVFGFLYNYYLLLLHVPPYFPL